MNYNTTQEKFWAGAFGNDYTDRNVGAQIEAASIALFSKVLSHTTGIMSAIEFGANRGVNLKALSALKPGIQMQAIEINKHAAEECSKIDNVSVYNGSAFSFECDTEWDLSFTRGLLIHIPPEQLESMYNLLYQSSRKYILIAEYYNPTPTIIEYRGNDDVLFKRDFAGEMLERYDDLNLVDYGFLYHLDHNFPTDDITWFLMKKIK